MDDMEFSNNLEKEEEIEAQNHGNNTETFSQLGTKPISQSNPDLVTELLELYDKTPELPAACLGAVQSKIFSDPLFDTLLDAFLVENNSACLGAEHPINEPASSENTCPIKPILPDHDPCNAKTNEILTSAIKEIK